MRLILCKNYEEISKEAAKILASQITLKPESVIGFATGSTPVGLYQNLIEMYKAGELDFSNVTGFNLDEYYPIAKDNSQSYYYFMQENLFKFINIKETFIPDGSSENPEEECKKYDALIDEKGGIDLQILGIGQNGHIGFNEPDENLNMNTHVTGLTQSTIEANSRFFDSIDEVPTKALTMGMASIMKAKTIILLASGKNKHDAVKELLTENITTNYPATLLKLHKDVILVVDEEAFNV